MERCLRRVLTGRAGARRARWGAATASRVDGEVPPAGPGRTGLTRDARDGAQPQRATLMERCLRRVLAGRAGARRARWGAATASHVDGDARSLPPWQGPPEAKIERERERWARSLPPWQGPPEAKIEREREMGARPASLARAAGGKDREREREMRAQPASLARAAGGKDTSTSLF